MAPSRVMDTRDGTGQSGYSLPLTQGETRYLNLSAFLPVASVSAVVLNVTVTNPSAIAGFITVYRGDEGQPATSNLNFLQGQTVANLVYSAVSDYGTVAFYNGSDGTIDVIADLSGYYRNGTDFVDSPGGFTPLHPTRLYDSRRFPDPDDSTLPPHGIAVISMSNPQYRQQGIINITATNATAAGWITAWPTGTPKPASSNVNFDVGQTVANLGMVSTGIEASGRYFLTLSNDSSGSVDVIVDLFGVIAPDFPTKSGETALVAPTRLLDTRSAMGAPAGQIQSQGTAAVQVLGRGGVPTADVSAVVVNLTVTNAQAPAGWVTAYGSGTRPLASNLNLAGRTVANLAVVPVGSDGSNSAVQRFRRVHRPDCRRIRLRLIRRFTCPGTRIQLVSQRPVGGRWSRRLQR
jgi:hypothetical protein